LIIYLFPYCLDDYTTAREKCKKAENTSDLNSEMSGEEKKKRKIKKSNFLLQKKKKTNADTILCRNLLL